MLRVGGIPTDKKRNGTAYKNQISMHSLIYQYLELKYTYVY
jgi:hypothetical protein